jgi:flavin reductase (DIM6/NTAB) family NADH-FMN oxidoreductase RutF
MEISLQNLDRRDAYKLLIGSVLPRPIAWVSTQDQAGGVNLAPFSFFNAVSIDPPLLAFSTLLKNDGTPKHTLLNIRSNGEFVVNIVSRPLAEQMNQTSLDHAEGVNEFEVAGLESASSVCVGPPRVKSALVSIECRLHQLISFGDKPLAGNLILGNILHFFVADSVYQDGRIDIEKLDPVGRLAGNRYSTIRDQFEILRE